MLHSRVCWPTQMHGTNGRHLFMVHNRCWLVHKPLTQVTALKPNVDPAVWCHTPEGLTSISCSSVQRMVWGDAQ